MPKKKKGSQATLASAGFYPVLPKPAVAIGK